MLLMQLFVALLDGSEASFAHLRSGSEGVLDEAFCQVGVAVDIGG